MCSWDDEWPGVNSAIIALRQAFGNADVEDTGGGCHCIVVPIEGVGAFVIGDADGPLGERGNQGWGASIQNFEGEYSADVCRIPDRGVPSLIDALRAFLHDGVFTGLAEGDILLSRLEMHRHLVTPVSVGDPECGECQELHRTLRQRNVA